MLKGFSTSIDPQDVSTLPPEAPLRTLGEIPSWELECQVADHEIDVRHCEICLALGISHTAAGHEIIKLLDTALAAIRIITGELARRKEN